MMLSTERRVRPSLIGLLLITLLALVSGCASVGGVPVGEVTALRGGPPPGLSPRNLRSEARQVLAESPTLRQDSLEAAASWQLPPIPDQYGPIDSVLVVIRGGFDTTAIGNAPEYRRWGPPSNQAAVARFPFDLAEVGPTVPGTAITWTAQACVYTIRRSVLALPVCATDEVVLSLPAPPQAINVALQARVISP